MRFGIRESQVGDNRWLVEVETSSAHGIERPAQEEQPEFIVLEGSKELVPVKVFFLGPWRVDWKPGLDERFLFLGHPGCCTWN